VDREWEKERKAKEKELKNSKGKKEEGNDTEKKVRN